MDTLATASASCGLLLLCGAALHDVMSRTVPNALAGAIAACGVVAQAAVGDLGWSLPGAFAVFVAAAMLWRRGLMGGGDVKLLGAASLLVPAAAIPAMLAAIALAGGALAVPYLVARRRLRRPPPRPCGEPAPRLLARAWRAERWRLRRGGPMPYAVAIAGGVLFVLSPALLTGVLP